MLRSQHAGLLIVSVMACSCSSTERAGSSSPPTRAGRPKAATAPPTLADPPKAPAASLAAERSIDPPPVKAGGTRIAQFEIDVALPPDATVRESTARADILWPCCAVEIALVLRSTVPQLKGEPRAAQPLCLPY